MSYIKFRGYFNGKETSKERSKKSPSQEKVNPRHKHIYFSFFFSKQLKKPDKIKT
jgi:hypothetical protein